MAAKIDKYGVNWDSYKEDGISGSKYFAGWSIKQNPNCCGIYEVGSFGFSEDREVPEEELDEAIKLFNKEYGYMFLTASFKNSSEAEDDWHGTNFIRDAFIRNGWIITAVFANNNSGNNVTVIHYTTAKPYKSKP